MHGRGEPFDHERRFDARRVPTVAADRDLVDVGVLNGVDRRPVLAGNLVLKQVRGLHVGEVADKHEGGVPGVDLLHVDLDAGAAAIHGVLGPGVLDPVLREALGGVDLQVAREVQAHGAFVFGEVGQHLVDLGDLPIEVVDQELGAVLLLEEVAEHGEPGLEVLDAAVLQGYDLEAGRLHGLDGLRLARPLEHDVGLELEQLLDVHAKVAATPLGAGLGHGGVEEFKGAFLVGGHAVGVAANQGVGVTHEGKVNRGERHDGRGHAGGHLVELDGFAQLVHDGDGAVGQRGLRGLCGLSGAGGGEGQACDESCGSKEDAALQDLAAGGDERGIRLHGTFFRGEKWRGGMEVLEVYVRHG